MYNNIVYDKGLAIANGSSAVAFNFKGGRLVLAGGGTFGGGNIGLEWSLDGTTWFPIGPQNGAATILSAAGTSMFYAAPGRYRVVVAGTTAPSLAYWVGDAQTGA